MFSCSFGPCLVQELSQKFMQEMNEIEPDMLPGEGSGFQVTGMIEWRQKSKPKKIPAPKFNAPKIRNRISEP